MKNCSSLIRRLLFLTLATNALTMFAANRSTNPPVIENVPGDVTVDCVADVPDPVDLAANDPEDGPLGDISPTDSPDAGSIDPCAGGTIFRVWEAMDSEGNITRDTQEITVLPDITPPVIDYAETHDTVACELLTDPALGYATWRGTHLTSIGTRLSDDCDNLGGFDYEPKEDFDQPCSTVTLVITTMDDCGNETLWTGTYTTIDTIRPELVGIPNDTTVSCSDGLPAPPVVSVVDNCNDLLVPTLTESSNQILDGTCNEIEFQVTRTWAVMDSCGNSAQASQVITIIDETPPDFTPPANITIACDADETDLTLTGEVANVMDDCGGAVDIFFVDQKVLGSCPNDTIINRTWQATDLCGNGITKVQIITKQDQEGPDFLVPPDTLVDCSVAEDLEVTGVPAGISDNCGEGGYTPSFTDVVVPDPLCEGKYTIRRTWEVEDECGNVSSQVQVISVEDLTPPSLQTPPADLVLTCVEDLDLEATFLTWIGDRGGAVATDNCSDAGNLTWTAYNRGTNDAAVVTDFICPARGDTVLFQEVDFVVMDECGNLRLSTATFLVMDQVAPVIIECPADSVLGTDAGQCSASFDVVAPLFTEECSDLLQTESIAAVGTLTNSAVPGEEGDTPVDPLELNFDLTASLPVNAFSDAVLRLQLVNADAESAEEYLEIYGEDGSLVGRTANSDAPCGDSDTTLMITKEDFNAWAVDGRIVLRLVPYIPDGLEGRFALNDICENGTTVSATLDLEVKEFRGVRFQYRIDDGAAMDASLTGSTPQQFSEGEHQVTYLITDCAGNADSCSFTVTVEDREAPQVTCPDDLVIVLASGTCDTMLTLPFVQDVTDNCPGLDVFSQQMPVDTSSALLTFRRDPNLNDFLAEERSYTFTNVAANALGTVELTLDVRGDFNSNGAFLEVFDENDELIGVTSEGLASCMTAGQVTFQLDAADFNSMAKDGAFTVRVVPNDIPVPPGVPGDGINPCDPDAIGADGDQDGVTYVFVRLSYEEVLPSYFITGVVEEPLTVMDAPTINPELSFMAGTSEVSYILEDTKGNADTCSYQVIVEDREAPVAACLQTTIFINPSELEGQTIAAQELDGGSTDNCMIDTMFLSPSTFTCEQAGSTVNATLTVLDIQGNESSCSTPIRIEAEAPQPSANSGLCGGDTLFLIANPPSATGGIPFTYRWFSPQGLLVSTDENPMLLNIDGDDAGTYRVEIQGITGCTAEGVVQVVIEDLPLTPSIQSVENVCIDEDVVLTSEVVPAGNNVMYHWYRGLPPEGDLIQTTTVPQHTIIAPHVSGVENYYLILEASGCVSPPSTSVAVRASQRPQAVVVRDQITICEGESIELGTEVSGADIEYQWTGPDGFTSASQLPAAIEGADLNNRGVYTLFVSRNGCESQPDFTTVNVLPRPATPSISDNGPLCTGETLTLVSDNNEAAVYHWISPDLEEFSTTANLFEVSSADESEEGFWRVYVTQFGCDSELSSSTKIDVNLVPDAIASAQRAEVCGGDELRLLGAPSINGCGLLMAWSRRVHCR